jgi:hypothetical protein
MMEFNSEWVTLGKHRTLLKCMRAFPTERLRAVADVARIAIESNLSAGARLVQVVLLDSQQYEIGIGTTFPKDHTAALQLEPALAAVFGVPVDHVQMRVTLVRESEVDLHFGVYERMLAEKIGAVSPLQ